MTDKSRDMLSTLFPVVVLMIAMASIQTGASLAKSMFPLVGAQGTTTLRLIFGGLIMLFILRPWRAQLDLKSLKTVILYGMSLGGMNLLFYMSLQTIPLGIAVTLEFTGPLVLALLSSRKALDFAWIALAVVGLLLLMPLGQNSASLDPMGVVYALGAAVCWATYILFGQKAGADNGVQTAALGVLIAAIFVAPIGVAHAGTALLNPILIPVALGVAVLSTALPYSLEMIALTRLPARTFGTLTSIEPAFGALSGMLFLNEGLSLMQWLAIASIILASAGATLTSRAEAPALIPAD